MLEAIEEFAPELFPQLFSCYSAPSSLYFNDTVIRSPEGVQQGDPLGPLLFCFGDPSLDSAVEVRVPTLLSRRRHHRRV